MLNTSAAKRLPTHDCHRNFANMFADYFDSKVQRISASFPTTIADPVNAADQLYRGRSWTWILWIFSNNINWTKLTYKVHGKNVVFLGPHTWISVDGLFFCSLACLVNMINLSFKDGLVPVLFKKAVLDPVIKKDCLDHEIYPNYKPISNLRLLSKATEKVVALRLTDHLEDNNFLKTFQWAYKKWHSTETALTQINKDLLRAIDDCLCHSCSFGPFSAGLLTPLTTKYYSHDLSVATVSRAMHWPGSALISQIGSNLSEWRMIVHLSTGWPVVFHRVLCLDRFCTLCTWPWLQMSSNVTVQVIISMLTIPISLS